MNSDDKKLIAEAVKSLRLIDVILYESRFSRPNDIPADKEQFNQMVKRVVAYSVDTMGKQQLLTIKVDLGVQIVDAENEEDNADVYIEIEADFIIQYGLEGELSDECLNAFSEFNGVHNAWPFWRQHVFDIAQRGQLPAIEIPLFTSDS